MKTIFKETDRDELIYRVQQLESNQQARWGKMTTYQMLKHCTLSEEMFLGKTQYKRLFIGRLFGGMALKGILKDENPLKKNQPTHAAMKISGSGNFEFEKNKWIDLLNSYSIAGESQFEHPFFGAMTRDQIGVYVYKHTDHHLRQFGK